jgi:hypothetical protein
VINNLKIILEGSYKDTFLSSIGQDTISLKRFCELFELVKPDVPLSDPGTTVKERAMLGIFQWLKFGDGSNIDKRGLSKWNKKTYLPVAALARYVESNNIKCNQLSDKLNETHKNAEDNRLHLVLNTDKNEEYILARETSSQRASGSGVAEATQNSYDAGAREIITSHYLQPILVETINPEIEYFVTEISDDGSGAEDPLKLILPGTNKENNGQ